MAVMAKMATMMTMVMTNTMKKTTRTKKADNLKMNTALAKRTMKVVQMKNKIRQAKLNNRKVRHNKKTGCQCKMVRTW